MWGRSEETLDTSLKPPPDSQSQPPTGTRATFYLTTDRDRVTLNT